MKKSHVLSALVVAIGVGGLAGMSQVSAQELDNTSPPIIQRLVEKFGLNEAEVKAVFEEEHTARKVKMKVKAEEHLTQLVTEGKITEAQKDAIIAKHAEMESERETLKQTLSSMSKEERKAEMKKHKAELESWAKEQGIDMQYLKFGFVMKSGPRGDKHGDMIMKTEVAS